MNERVAGYVDFIGLLIHSISLSYILIKVLNYLKNLN